MTSNNVVLFRPREPVGPSHSDGDGSGPQVVCIRITLDCGGLQDAPVQPEPVKRTVRAGGFWTGVLVVLSLMFMGVL